MTTSQGNGYGTFPPTPDRVNDNYYHRDHGLSTVLLISYIE